MEYGIQFVVNSILADNDWPFFIVERDFDHVFLAVKSQGNDDDDGRFKGKWNKIDREHETWHVTARQFRNGLDSVHLVRSIALRHLVILKNLQALQVQNQHIMAQLKMLSNSRNQASFEENVQCKTTNFVKMQQNSNETTGGFTPTPVGEHCNENLHSFDKSGPKFEARCCHIPRVNRVNRTIVIPGKAKKKVCPEDEAIRRKSGFSVVPVNFQGRVIDVEMIKQKMNVLMSKQQKNIKVNPSEKHQQHTTVAPPSTTTTDNIKSNPSSSNPPHVNMTKTAPKAFPTKMFKATEISKSGQSAKK
ncbi:hypothetical protein BLOT_007432 [Blomia tropicalis]|nr:hypothetical protein BLOT_007432 [Blomia tropicalis]